MIGRGTASAGAAPRTAFFWVHAVLISTAIVIGLGVLVVGVRAHRSSPSR